ncbi:hypothetical protein [Archaeoglobus neptunius]|uniref:hypothetical protein n=1 Tax=Archaeoglobus neptunius TaxID=2798580 RepID=UPI0019279A9F|nr:hypothetical protein [Archaeoglobus neptunius]
MPVTLKFAVYQCECGEIFKKREMLRKHCEKWRHSPDEEYTVTVSVSRDRRSVEYELTRGKAENGYL